MSAWKVNATDSAQKGALEQPEGERSAGGQPAGGQVAGGQVAGGQPRIPKGQEAYFRAENEGDDGYDPYSDRRPEAPLFERDPWR